MNEEASNRLCSSISSIRVTAFSAMGSRKYQEDAFSVAYQKSDNGKDLDYAFFGIYDGHGGNTASIFAKNHLMNYIVDQPQFWSEEPSDILESIKKGFHECHLAMWKDLDKWPPTASGLPSTAGTTASVAFLRKGKLYIGHCGDSGIVLGKSNPKGGPWIAEPLTIEHKPESPEELARIESFGGKVQQKQGIHRVVWYRPKNPHQGPIRRNTRIEEVPFLAVARSLGDLWSYNYKTQKFVVSPEPDVCVIDVQPDFKCLIFASDGLWNVMDYDHSVESVFETERRNDHNAKLGINHWRNPSRILVEDALEKWRSNSLRADNTSVVCVMLDPPNKRNMFKFCRTGEEEGEAVRTIFDYSTSEAYNLDYVEYDQGVNHVGLTRQPANYDLSYFQTSANAEYQYDTNAYNTFETYGGYQVASTSSQNPASLTYQTTSNESAFVKACCRNNYTLARANEEIPYHASYEQHREMYESMALRPYPPLHYAYRPALPSLHANLYDHTYKPMERYNYIRPTPEELTALHSEEDDEEESSDYSDDDMESESQGDEKDVEMPVVTPEMPPASSDDSIQIFEISSSNDDSSEEKKNDKENTETLTKKRKQTATSTGRFYATRQTDRKMRSANLVVRPTIAREKNQRKMQKTIRKAVKTMQVEQAGKKLATVDKPPQTALKPTRVLRSAQADTVRSLRSKGGSNSGNREKIKHRRMK